MNDPIEYKLYIDYIPDKGIRRKNGIIADTPEKDFYINLSIYKNIQIDDYVDVEIDPLTLHVERQLINPYFIELGFFERIEDLDDLEDRAGDLNININK